MAMQVIVDLLAAGAMANTRAIGLLNRVPQPEHDQPGARNLTGISHMVSAGTLAA